MHNLIALSAKTVTSLTGNFHNEMEVVTYLQVCDLHPSEMDDWQGLGSIYWTFIDWLAILNASNEVDCKKGKGIKQPKWLKKAGIHHQKEI